MMVNSGESTVTTPKDAPGVRRPWTAPEIAALPPLTELTLATGASIPGSGSTGGGGGTVF